MIDVEIDVFNKVYNAILAEYPSAYITGEYVRMPESFPHVSLIEMSNTVYERASALSKIENAVRVMYEANIYSNLVTGKKSQCKAILAILDSEMEDMGFIRTQAQPTPNLEDATIYRIVARYERIIANNEEV